MGLVAGAAGGADCAGIGGVAGALGAAIGRPDNIGAGIGGAGGGTTISGGGSITGLRTNGSAHVGQGTVWPVPSAGYSMAWPQCGHSDFKNSPIGLTLSILKEHVLNGNPLRSRCCADCGVILLGAGRLANL